MLSTEVWGVRPVLFYFQHRPIPSYAFFVAVALILGTCLFVLEAYRNDHFCHTTWMILFAGLVFGGLGAKLPIWLGHSHELVTAHATPNLLLSGRTIVGALIGGTLGVVLTKHIFKIKLKLGYEMALALTLGMAIGRVGCFLRGCCYGMPTHVRWGVNFGDGILRYPTQLMESLFCFLLFFVLLELKKRVKDPGRFFAIFLVSYMIFRFFIEFIRFNRYKFLGLSVFQWTVILVLFVTFRFLIIRWDADGKE